MKIELRIYQTFTQLYKEDIHTERYHLTERLFIGDSIRGLATVKEVVYDPQLDTLVCNAIIDNQVIDEKEVD